MIHTGRLGRKHFTLAKQEAMIKGHGQQVVVHPVLQCPCLTDDRQFHPLCPQCQGTGRYYPPGTTYTTMLLLTQETSKRTFEDPGTWTLGTMQASVLPGVRLCERDRVVLVDIRDTFTDEVLVRGVDDTVRFRTNVKLVMVADLERAYRPLLDYLLSPPHTVSWQVGGLAPAFGAQYTCKYEAAPEYLVVNDSPRLRVEHRIAQSQEVILQRLDKLGEDV